MTFYSRFRIVAGVLLAASVALSGCGADPGEDQSAVPIGFGVVVGARGNSPDPDWTVIDESLPVDLAPGSRVVAVGVDGTPDGYGLFEETVATYEFSGDAVDAAQRLRVNLKKAVTDAAATEPEADVLGAIAAVARSIRAAGTGTIVVADSMVPTNGMVSALAGVLELAPEDLVEQLADQHELPDLSGMSLVIVGQGNTAPPQQPLTEQTRRKLRMLWEHLFLVAGAGSVRYHDVVVTEPAPPGLPPVTPVEFNAPAPISTGNPPPDATLATTPEQTPAATDAQPPLPPGCHVELTNAQVTFLPDSAAYLDPAQALSVIKEQAVRIQACPGQIRVTGTTSSAGTPEGRSDTSSQRANAVADTLASILAIDRTRIETVGAGMDNPWHINDRGAGDDLLPDVAVRNRSVHIEILPDL